MSLSWSTWSALILGLFVGFLLEWIWDIYFRGAGNTQAQKVETERVALEKDLLASKGKQMKLEDQLKNSQLDLDRLASLDLVTTERDGLRDRVKNLEAKLASFKADSSPDPEVRNAENNLPKSLVSNELSTLKTENELLRDQLNELSMGIREPLEKINGIGLVFQRKLWEAGVNTFQQLAESTPESVRSIIKPEEWQRIEVDHWIQEATEFARGDRN